ncbi:MAG TPA: PLDc N-terminal domain-containing protein [Verrucomicrobiae bacterium]|nr:PLDc N-terminal domain-containing protein [Verrucomicrobiae bacterium]
MAPLSGLAGLVVLILDIIAIVDCLKSNADVVKKLLWILVILLLPLLGMLLYFLLARGK